jgi:hypothetical protein
MNLRDPIRLLGDLIKEDEGLVNSTGYRLVVNTELEREDSIEER